jgi:hypothetical protein
MLRYFQTEGMHVYEVFEIIVAMFAQAADIIALRADCLGRLLDEGTDLFDSGSCSPGRFSYFLRCITGVAEDFSQPEYYNAAGSGIPAVGIRSHSDLEDKLYLYRRIERKHSHAHRSPRVPSRLAPDFMDEIRCRV